MHTCNISHNSTFKDSSTTATLASCCGGHSYGNVRTRVIATPHYHLHVHPPCSTLWLLSTRQYSTEEVVNILGTHVISRGKWTRNSGRSTTLCSLKLYLAPYKGKRSRSRSEDRVTENTSLPMDHVPSSVLPTVLSLRL